MTRTITPKNSGNILMIYVTVIFSTSASGRVAAALFQDAVSNAIAVGSTYFLSGATLRPASLNFTHFMTAGTTNEITFKLRLGNETAGTTTFNGDNGTRRYGGVLASSITITEIST